MSANRKQKQQRPATRRPLGSARDRPRGAARDRPLLYKVVELSTVDESALERTVNQWVPRGWKLEGVQFAMRESSKRPSMAFVFFTREGVPVLAADEEITVNERSRPVGDARLQLRRLADDPAALPPPVSARERLAQLAGDDE